MVKKYSLLLLSLMTFLFSQAQPGKLNVLAKGKDTNIRGISVFQSKTIWVSGSKGQIGKSLDGGRTWRWYQPAGYENRDFRDIQVFDAQTAIILAVDTPAILLKTIDGGETWRKVYEDHTPGMFLDAMDFTDSGQGIVVGDPVQGVLFIAKTTDLGDHWKQVSLPIERQIASGEAFFAASGTNIHLNPDGSFLLSSGGRKSNLWNGDDHVRIPTMMQGGETTGANGMAVRDSLILIAGGDFAHPDRKDSCLAFSDDLGRSWRKNGVSPGGYMSTAAIVNPETLFVAGLNGAWRSNDQGQTWKNISEQPFNVSFYDSKSEVVYFAGPEGYIAACFLN